MKQKEALKKLQGYLLTLAANPKHRLSATAKKLLLEFSEHFGMKA